MGIIEALFVMIFGLLILIVVIAALKNVRGPRKGKYRLSWFERKQ